MSALQPAQLRAAVVIRELLEANGIPFAVIGATAVALHGYPRATFDVDLLTTHKEVLALGWREVTPPDLEVESRRGDFDDDLAGVVRFRQEGLVVADVVVGKWKWQREVVARASEMEVGGVRLPVVRLSDLLLLKVDAGGPLDLRDAVKLVQLHGDAVVEEAATLVPSLPVQMRKGWERFLRDLELVRRESGGAADDPIRETPDLEI